MSDNSVPGTEVLVYDENNPNYAHLQHMKEHDVEIILIPQPSLTDPNDPLRWSLPKKWIVFGLGLLYSFLGSLIGPAMSGGMVDLAASFNIPISHLSWAAGIYLLLSGVSTLGFMPISVKYGRRPALLFSAITLGAGCIWCGVASDTTFVSFFLARAFAGLFAGPVEALVPSTIIDIFFLHDRGEKIAIYGLVLLGGYEISPILSAVIIQDMGMKWAFYLIAFGLFLTFIAIALFMPETAYYGPRTQIGAAPTVTTTESQPPALETEKSSGDPLPLSPGKTDPATISVSRTSGSESGVEEIPPKPYIETLKFWSRDAVNPNIKLRVAYLRPLVLLAYPTVLWSTLIFGMALSWNIVLALTVAQLFAPPPYLFSNAAQGLVFVSPLIGSLIGTYLCGPLGDRIALYYARRNGGIQEPEMRLPVAAPAAVLTLVGICIAAPCYHYQTHWIGPIVGFGVLSIGSQIGCNLAMVYAIDCHKDLVGELMITISVMKSIFAWAWTWFINDWIIRNGMMTVYFLVALINVAVYATTFLFYYKGKDYRRWIQETNLFSRAGLS